MTAQEILANLSQLEKELESISSARLLVENTVTAYKEVQGEIKIFFSEFQKVIVSLNKISNAFEFEKSTLTTDVKTTINVLKGQLDTLNKEFANQCNAIVIEFVNGTKDAVNEFKNTTKALTSDYELNNAALKDRITELSTVQGTISKAVASVATIKTDITTLQTQLIDSQQHQDATLASIAAELKSTGTRNDEMLSKLSEELKQSHEDQDKDLDVLKQAQKAQFDKMESVLNEEEKLVSGIELTISTINDKIVYINTLLNTVKQNLNDVSNKLNVIQAKQETLASAVEYAKTGISGLGNLINNKSKEIYGRFDEIVNLNKSAKTMLVVNIVICIIVLVVTLFR